MYCVGREVLTLRQCRRIDFHFKVTELGLLGGGSVTDVGSGCGGGILETSVPNSRRIMRLSSSERRKFGYKNNAKLCSA
jgi:hypothetical protein